MWCQAASSDFYHLKRNLLLGRNLRQPFPFPPNLNLSQGKEVGHPTGMAWAARPCRRGCPQATEGQWPSPPVPHTHTRAHGPLHSEGKYERNPSLRF